MPDYQYSVSINGIQQLSSHNRSNIERSHRCGCYSCCGFFAPNKIHEWIDPDPKGQGNTALCPHCGVDAVLASAAIELTPELLAELERWWFGRAEHEKS